jgi:hypothetical protein
VEVAAGVLRPFIGSGTRCGAGNGRRQRCAIKAPVTRREDDGASSIRGGNEEEATMHLFIFPLGTGGRQTEARGAVAHWRAVVAAGPNGLVTRADKENSRKKKKKLNGPPGNFGPDWKWVSFGGNKEKGKWAGEGGIFKEKEMGCQGYRGELILGCAEKKRKRFSDFDSRNDIQIQFLNIAKSNLNWIFKIR